jgi:UDP:flavonoid glycosyltransferase YjiC (YdhE family)
MSRFVLATLGSLGDLHPYIAVGQALRARGHQALIATSAEYEVAVQAAGLEFAAVRPSLAQMGDQAHLARRLFHPMRGPERLIRGIVMPHLRAALADTLAAARGADLLVSHPLTPTLPLVAHQLKLPWVSTVLAPMSFMSRHEPLVMAGPNLLQRAADISPIAYDLLMHLVRWTMRNWEAPLHAYRRELGLPRSGQVMLLEGQFSPHGTLALFDASLGRPQADWPVLTQVCGTPLFDGQPAQPERLQQLQRFLEQGDAPLVFGLGSSVVWIAGDYWRHAIAAAQSLGRRAILLTGATQLPALPPGILALDYLPYSAVFPHAAAVVHQAGIGTLSQALRSGRPQLITPVAFDQPDNAARAAALGVGRVLPFRKVSGPSLTGELAALLADPAYDHAARRVATELASVDGAATAASALIQMVRA